MNIFILLVVITSSTSRADAGVATLQAEFSSQFKCEVARIDQINQIKQMSKGEVIASGCYAK